MRELIFTAGVVLALLLTTKQADAQHALDASFIKYDRDANGFLDSSELAKAFRGKIAKPVVDRIGARESHADHVFLNAWDKDRDGSISRAEFEMYEQKFLADASARARAYNRAARTSYRAPHRHHGHSHRRGGTNPYLSMVGAQQRVYQSQWQVYVTRPQYGIHTPHHREHGGTKSHHRSSKR